MGHPGCRTASGISSRPSSDSHRLLSRKGELHAADCPRLQDPFSKSFRIDRWGHLLPYAVVPILILCLGPFFHLRCHSRRTRRIVRLRTWWRRVKATKMRKVDWFVCLTRRASELEGGTCFFLVDHDRLRIEGCPPIHRHRTCMIANPRRIQPKFRSPMKESLLLKTMRENPVFRESNGMQVQSRKAGEILFVLGFTCIIT